MKTINICLMAFLILLLGVGFVSAANDEMVSDGNATVLDDVDMNVAEDRLDSTEDEIIGAGTHVEVNSYNHSSLNPHSVDINDDSDYVAYVYTHKESQGNVSVLIDDDGVDREIFNRDIQSLYQEVDENDTDYSYFYIKPSDIMESLNPDLYYITVVYKYGLTLTESNDGWVRLVNDTSHVSVSAPPEILIGDPFNSYISIFVEGTLGNLRVLIDNQEIINGSVFDLKYDDETQELNNFIHVDMRDLSLGQHTYEIFYYGGNWKDVTFSDNINVTYLFDVLVDDDYFYYGDEINFMIVVPNDASSNEIRVNNKRYGIDLVDGVANLTLSDLNLGENTLNFTYDDVKYGEKSVQIELTLNPRINVSSTVKYGSDENISAEFPSDSQGQLNILSNGYLMDSVDVVNGMVTYSFALWPIGSYKLELQYDDGKYYVDKEVTIDVVPNVQFKNNLAIGESSYVSVDIGVEGNITVFCNGQNLSTVNLIDGKMNITIPSSSLHLGENILMLKYDGDDLFLKPFYYFDEKGNYVPYQYILTVGPDYLEIPDEFSQDGSGNIILGLPEGFNGSLDVNVNGGLLSSVMVSGGRNNILVSGLKKETNNLNVVLTDAEGYSYNITKEVSVPKIDPQMNITIPKETAIPTFTVILPDDAAGRLIIRIGDYSDVKYVKNGIMTVTIPGLADGDYNATLIYSDDEKYSSFTKYVMMTIKTVDFKDPKLAITVPNVYQGKNSVITVSTDSSFSGTVNVKINSNTYAVGVVNGKGTKSISGLKSGTYTAVATFTGNNLFKSSTKSASFKVMDYVKLTLKKVTVKKSAKKLAITATLKINGKAAKGKTLKFKFNKKEYKAKTNKKGVAKITVKKTILKKLKVGKKIKYQVTYGKTVKRTVKVKK